MAATTSFSRHGIQTRNRWLVLTGLIATTFVVALLSGTQVDVFSFLIQMVTSSDHHVSDDSMMAEKILMALRLPRIAMGFAVGGMLGLSGLVYQSLLKNSLAEPYILGVSSGAAFFAVAAQALFGNHYLIVTASAFVGGLLSIGLLFAIVGFKQRSSATLLLCGVMINFMMAALMMLTVFAFLPDKAGGIVTMWMGSLAGVWQQEVWILMLLLIAGLIYFMWFHRSLNALAAGSTWAINVGFSASKLMMWHLVVASLMVSACVACVGMIGFVGLIIPHVARLVFGMQSKHLVPATVLLGAMFLIGADAGARGFYAFNTEMPVGVISSLIGGPTFIYLLIKRNRGEVRG